MKSKKVLFVIVLFMLFSQTLFSQIVMQGVVKDQHEVVVTGALVELIDLEDNSNHNSTTNSEGLYTIVITQTGILDKNALTPQDFSLLQNYPNPFNPSTMIVFTIKQPEHIRLEIHNILGQKVKTLLDGFFPSTTGQMVWDATDNMGKGVPAGVYIYSLYSNSQHINKKMLLLDGNHKSTGTVHSQKPDNVNHSGILKAMGSEYLLRVTGADIETFEINNFLLEKSKIFNINVTRIENNTNVAPIAALTIIPNPIIPGQQFTLDASATTDDNDDITQLQFRYDVEGDGVYTEWGTGNSVAYSNYSMVGNHNAFVQVKDSEGLTSIATCNYIIENNDYIKITFPNGGETLIVDQENTIEWETNMGGKAKVDLYQYDVFLLTIKESTSNDG